MRCEERLDGAVVVQTSHEKFGEFLRTSRTRIIGGVSGIARHGDDGGGAHAVD